MTKISAFHFLYTTVRFGFGGHRRDSSVSGNSQTLLPPPVYTRLRSGHEEDTQGSERKGDNEAFEILASTQDVEKNCLHPRELAES